AIHPHTLGGCMGDGQHLWAAAEWVLMVRALFVRAEGDRLILGSGLPAAWLVPGVRLRLGPTPTPHGPLTVHVSGTEAGALVRGEANWRGQPPAVEVRVPGHEPRRGDGAPGRLSVARLACLGTEGS